MYDNKKKKPKQIDPDSLGTGGARRTAERIMNRRQQIDAIVDGTYDRKGQRDSNEKKPKKGK